MTDATSLDDHKSSFALKLLYVLSLGMVVVGLINATPGIPGYDALAASLTGEQGTQFRKFPFEWFYPLFFSVMMIIVVMIMSPALIRAAI